MSGAPNHPTNGTEAQARKGLTRHPNDVTISDEIAIALVEKRIMEVRTDCGRRIVIVAIEKHRNFSPSEASRTQPTDN